MEEKSRDTSLINRKFTKKDLEDLENIMKFKNAEINAGEVDIEGAVNDALAEFRKDFGLE